MGPSEKRARHGPGDDQSAPSASEIAKRLDDLAKRIDAWPQRIEPDSSYAGAFPEFVVENQSVIQAVAAALKGMNCEPDSTRLLARFSDAVRSLNHIRVLKAERDNAAAMGSLSDDLVRQLAEREGNLVARAGDRLRGLAWEMRRVQCQVLGRPIAKDSWPRRVAEGGETNVALGREAVGMEAGNTEPASSPQPPPRDEIRVTTFEYDILRVLDGKRLSQGQVAQKLGRDADGHLKSTLSSLVKRGILGNKRPGYFIALADWRLRVVKPE